MIGPHPSRFRDVFARISAISLSGLIAADRWYGSLYSGGDALSRSSLPSWLERWCETWRCAMGSWVLVAREVSMAVLLPLPSALPTGVSDAGGGCAW